MILDAGLSILACSAEVEEATSAIRAGLAAAGYSGCRSFVIVIVIGPGRIDYDYEYDYD